MNKLYAFAANGVEEVECLTTVDILRRGGVEVCLAAVGKDRMIEGSHGIRFEADILLEEADLSDADALFLPGGMPGTLNLQADGGVNEALRSAARKGTWICAICAAPRVPGSLGLLKGERATCYPGNEEYLEGAECTGSGVEVSGRFITGKSAGWAVPFALKVLEKLEGEEVSEKIRKAIVFEGTV